MSQPLSTLLADGPATSQPDRAYRLLVAQRLAEVVEAVHAAGSVIGNLNAHRVLVEPGGMVTLGDDAGPTTEVRAPAYTAPELQGSFTGYARPEAQHDCFALAVLLFQILMAGQHPYAGQWVGGGNLPDIPKAIQLGLYAYGGSSVTPPPGAPAPSTLEPGLADLFKRSFAATSAIFRNRPTGAEWARALAAVRQTGQAVASPTTLASPELTYPSGPVLNEPQVPVKPAAPTAPVVLDPLPDSAPQSPGTSRVQPAPLPEHRAEPTPSFSTPAPKAEAAPVESYQDQPQTALGTPAPQPSEPRQDIWVPEPAVVTDVAPQPAAGVPAAPAKRKFSRRAMLERVVPPAGALDDPSAPVQPDQSQGSVWGALVGELRWLAAPDQSPPSSPYQSQPSAPYQPEPSTWRNLASEIRWFVESDLHWLTDPEFWRRFGKFVVPGLLFVIWFAFGRSGDDSSNRAARPAAVRSTMVPATETPQPRPTVRRSAPGSPRVASFGSNFDVSDGVIPSTGEQFSAYVRDRLLHLEVFARGARGKVMFNAAPANGDFNFTVHVGETTGQGEILIYARELESGRTWVFAIDPGATTWGIYEERPSNNPLKVVIARTDYSSAIARQPLRTVSVTRKGERTRLLINGVAVNPRIARAMPQVVGPVTVGVGAMIPDEPDYADEPFIVTVDRVAMLADEG